MTYSRNPAAFSSDCVLRTCMIYIRWASGAGAIFWKAWMAFLPQEDDTAKATTAYFRGIVATYRPYYDKSPQSKCRKITFITVSYDNGKYIDVVANGYYPLSKFKIVSGHGTLEGGNYIQCKKLTLEN